MLRAELYLVHSTSYTEKHLRSCTMPRFSAFTLSWSWMHHLINLKEESHKNTFFTWFWTSLQLVLGTVLQTSSYTLVLCLLEKKNMWFPTDINAQYILFTCAVFLMFWNGRSLTLWHSLVTSMHLSLTSSWYTVSETSWHCSQAPPDNLAPRQLLSWLAYMKQNIHIIQHWAHIFSNTFKLME